MFDVLLRALLHPIDYSGVFHSHTLTLTACTDVGSGIMSFDFTSSKPIIWKAGQHAIFTLPGRTFGGKQWRVFSIASASHGGIIKIATHFPPEPSEFKQVLRALQPGDTVAMRGPLGEMYIQPSMQTVIGIAGGIGITPFRALLKEFEAGMHEDTTLELIYAGKDDFFAFAAECHRVAERENVTIQFVQTPDKVNAALDALVERYQNDATYFISGSPGMIGAIQSRLRKRNIKHIINDPFKGY